jgi:hypothetical protein
MDNPNQNAKIGDIFYAKNNKKTDTVFEVLSLFT